MVTKQPTKHLKDLCKELGGEYSIRVFDMEQVIYRDFKDGFDVEISGVNTTDPKKRATIFLWDNRSGHRIVATIRDVPQGSIGDRVEELLFSHRNQTV